MQLHTKQEIFTYRNGTIPRFFRVSAKPSIPLPRIAFIKLNTLKANERRSC